MKPYYTIPGTRCIADLSRVGDARWHVHRINVPREDRGKGYGSELLRWVCYDADRWGVELELIPTPSGGLTAGQLVEWYKRHGFQWAGRPMHSMMLRSPTRRLQIASEAEVFIEHICPSSEEQ